MLCGRYIYIYLYTQEGRDSSVGIAIRYGLDSTGIESGGGWGSRFCTPVQTGPGVHRSLPYNGQRVFPGGRADGT